VTCQEVTLSTSHLMQSSTPAEYWHTIWAHCNWTCPWVCLSIKWIPYKYGNSILGSWQSCGDFVQRLSPCALSNYYVLAESFSTMLPRVNLRTQNTLSMSKHGPWLVPILMRRGQAYSGLMTDPGFHLSGPWSPSGLFPSISSSTWPLVGVM
jgi:hypothetical protein